MNNFVRDNLSFRELCKDPGLAQNNLQNIVICSQKMDSATNLQNNLLEIDIGKNQNKETALNKKKGRHSYRCLKIKKIINKIIIFRFFFRSELTIKPTLYVHFFKYL